VAERRLVSVLFADLVGFTTLSEGRDAEEVRELLSRYFESCKRLISLYGGTVEKFIGDAVMAVWGAPTAQEDDAERSVRAALDVVGMVSALGQEVGAPELRARAGVHTGSAAVTLGAVGEGMVAGDLVNTASRIQTAAEPGSVVVGEATKRATEAAIAYADAGAHELKGKPEPVRLFRALRVTAGRAGTLKGEGLEPPFVGRDHELRLVKELFHGPRRRRRLTSFPSSESPESASRGFPGSSRSMSTAWLRTSGGTAAAASPTATASPTGQSPRWSGCVAGSPRTTSRHRRARSSARPCRSTFLTRTNGSGSSLASHICSRSKGRRRPTRRISSPPGASSSSG